MPVTMTFCGSITNKEKLGYDTTQLCAYSVYNNYIERATLDGGSETSNVCLFSYIESLK